jgi:hypothetical protein
MSTTPPPVVDPSKAAFSWVDPTTNMDATPISAGEITGYAIGIRSLTAAGSAAGTYPLVVSVNDPAAVTEPLAAIGTVLKPDSYAAAIQAVGPVPSDWTAEASFTIAAPKPSPPSAFAVS